MSFTKDELLAMSLTKLRDICKTHGISGCYKFKSADKEEFVDFILKNLKGAAKQSPKSPKSPTVISKSEISKMTVKSLKELLKGCGQSTVGLKAELVDRVFMFCKDSISKPPKSSEKKSLTVKELKELLAKKNITHYNPKLKKENLEYLASTKTCNVETRDLCAADEICDLRDGICTKKEFISGTVSEIVIDGHKIVGTKEALDKIPKRTPSLGQKEKRTKKELLELVEQKGIRHSMGLSLKKEDLESLLESVECDPVNKKGCMGEQVCDLRDGFCVNPDYVKKTGIIKKDIGGIKVLGSKDAVEQLEKKFAEKSKKKILRLKRVPKEQELDEETIFPTPPLTVLPKLPSVEVPRVIMPAPPVSPPPVSPVMPKIRSKMIKSMTATDIQSTVNDRIKASLGLTRL